MVIRWSIQGMILLILVACSSNNKIDPSCPIAKFGKTPSIDGVFSDGEWDDAIVVQENPKEKFWLKHDNTNLYFAFEHDGGNLYLSKNTSIQILHASAQLGSAEYKKFDHLMYSLEKPFEWKLGGLQNETAKYRTELVADYLSENGWVASTGPLGHFSQAEWAVSGNSKN